LRRLIALIIALAILIPSWADAYDVLVLQSRRDPALEEVTKGLRTSCAFSHRLLVMSDYAEVDVTRIVREEHPRLILVIGDGALRAASRINKVPVMSLMAVGVRRQAEIQPNLTGIDMYAPPARYMELFKRLKARRVGVIYSKSRSGHYLRGARHAAEKAGIELVSREVSSPRETMGQLSSLSGRVDALWMLPDPGAVNRESSMAYFRFGRSREIPIVSFSSAYLGLGASAVVDIGRSSLASQGCDMVMELLQGKGTDTVPIQFPDLTSVRTNPQALKRFKQEQSNSGLRRLSSL